jgi:hypothetical protein
MAKPSGATKVGTQGTLLLLTTLRSRVGGGSYVRGCQVSVRGGDATHCDPPGGGLGAKKRPLVLYKLAGFCAAAIVPLDVFFCVHKNAQFCTTFWAPQKPGKTPQFGDLNAARLSLMFR